LWELHAFHFWVESIVLFQMRGSLHGFRFSLAWLIFKSPKITNPSQYRRPTKCVCTFCFSRTLISGLFRSRFWAEVKGGAIARNSKNAPKFTEIEPKSSQTKNWLELKSSQAKIQPEPKFNPSQNRAQARQRR
jgi:hypothetical protein